MTTASVEITDGPSVCPSELDAVGLGVGVTSGAQDAGTLGVFATCELATATGTMKLALSIAPEAAIMRTARMRLIEAYTFASLTVGRSLGAEHATSLNSVPQTKWKDLVEALRPFIFLSQRQVVT